MNNESITSRSGSAGSFLKRLEKTTGRQPFVVSGPKTAVVGFRCSKTGRPFHVVLTQASYNHRYQISQIVVSPSGAPAQDTGEALNFSREFSNGDLDFSGWQCPHCSHRGTGSNDSFVECTSCKKFVCGGRNRKLPNGDILFTCHDGCGGWGTIEGFIKSYAAEASDPMALLRATGRNSIGNGTANGGLLLKKMTGCWKVYERPQI